MFTIDEIIKKAEELSKLMQNSDITRAYQESLAAMGKDIESQDLLKRIVLFGKEVNDMIAAGENSASMSAENALLKEQLDQNDLVKTHIQNQQAYVHLVQKVLERIRNPKTEDTEDYGNESLL